MSDPVIMRPDEDDEQGEVRELGMNALSALNQSEHAAMVQTANIPRMRRKLKEFDEKLHTYATHSQPVALSMFYSLPRAGKQIIGASVRFAEILVPCWKNCAAATRMIGDARETVTAQGIFIDYEANIRVSVETSRRITDKNGNRFNADMIVTTGNAASSIAYRNAILRGVPRALWNPAYEAAKLTAVGKSVSLTERVSAALEYLAKKGVTEWQIFNAIGVASAKDMEMDHVLTLRVLCEEINKGEKTIEEVFGSEYDKEIDSLFQQLGKNATAQRMLRDSYMGRAKELAEYLRSQLPSSGTKASAKPETTPETQQTAEKTEEISIQEEQPAKRGRGRPRKEQTAEPQQQEAQQEEKPVESEKQESEPQPSGKFDF